MIIGVDLARGEDRTVSVTSKERFVLCRRTLNEFGERTNYCGRPIKTPNLADWCDGCASRLPIWP